MGWTIGKLTLSAAGRMALTGYFGEGDAKVVIPSSDALGLWAMHGEKRVDGITLFLIRWEFIETAQQDLVAKPPKEEKIHTMGFKGM